MSTASARREATSCACCAALVARMTALEETVALLQRSRPNRDQADADLRRLLPGSTRQLPFKVHQLLRHAAVDEYLKRALVAADVDSPASLGVWLRDRAGTQDGVALVRLPGRRWQALHIDTYVSAQDSEF